MELSKRLTRFVLKVYKAIFWLELFRVLVRIEPWIIFKIIILIGGILIMDKAMLQECKDKYGKVYSVKVTVPDLENGEDEKELEFLFKQPSPLDYDRFIKDANKKASQSFKNLVISCVVEEDSEALQEAISDYPALPSSLAAQLLKLMGLSDNVSLKKL